MTEYLTEQDVRAIAAYARVGLSEEELAQMTVDLNSIIGTLEPILEHDDLGNVQPTFYPVGGLSNVMREDVETPSFTQEKALANAVQKQDGAFLVPSILGGGEQ